MEYFRVIRYLSIKNVEFCYSYVLFFWYHHRRTATATTTPRHWKLWLRLFLVPLTAKFPTFFTFFVSLRMILSSIPRPLLCIPCTRVLVVSRWTGNGWYGIRTGNVSSATSSALSQFPPPINSIAHLPSWMNDGILITWVQVNNFN